LFRWIEHTGELELEIEAATEPAVFADALAAYAELVRDDGSPDSERREIELRSDDRAALLAEWLEELVYLADAQRFVPEHLADLTLEADSLRAIVRGHTGAPNPLVKAVTRHRLAFEPSEGEGWRARVVLDV
jgi:SHS2 domain-containing protein